MESSFSSSFWEELPPLFPSLDRPLATLSEEPDLSEMEAAALKTQQAATELEKTAKNQTPEEETPRPERQFARVETTALAEASEIGSTAPSDRDLIVAARLEGAMGCLRENR